jgi:hypothetical protein
VGLRLTEGQLQQTLIEAARLYGWRVNHIRPARTEQGWRTPVQGDVGFPDLVLARGGVVLFRELKSDRGRIGPGQAEWAEAIGDAYRIWRPADLDEALRELRRQ